LLRRELVNDKGSGYLDVEWNTLNSAIETDNPI